MKKVIILISLLIVSLLPTFGRGMIDTALRSGEYKIYSDPEKKFVYINYLEKIYRTETVTTYVYYDYGANGRWSYKYLDHKLDTVPQYMTFRNSYTEDRKILESVYNNTLKIPTGVYERYRLSNKLMIAGWVDLSVGTGLAIIGGILYGTGLKNQNQAEVISGSVFLGTGGTLVGFSIPLLCFGDNIKRESNVNCEIFNLLR